MMVMKIKVAGMMRVMKMKVMLLISMTVMINVIVVMQMTNSF